MSLFTGLAERLFGGETRGYLKLVYFHSVRAWVTDSELRGTSFVKQPPLKFRVLNDRITSKKRRRLLWGDQSV